MTRPNIVRADTIDLQDEDHPSAAEHQKPAIQGGLAPHQRAEVHHVLEERNSEEHSLQEAWNISDNLTEEPGAIEQAQQQEGTNSEPTVNGTQSEGAEGGGEAGESEAEGDDDMMDRISSSPSIDDGGYLLSARAHFQRRAMWPERTSSLSPSPRNTPTPTRMTSNKSASSSLDSSPFLQTPQHYPLHVRRTGKAASTLSRESEWPVNSLDDDPRLSPLIRFQRIDSSFLYSSKHHHMGLYNLEPDLDPEGACQSTMEQSELYEHYEDASQTAHLSLYLDQRPNISREGCDDGESESSVIVHGSSSTAKLFGSPIKSHPSNKSLAPYADGTMNQSPSLASMASVDLQDVLLPVDDPLLDTPPSPTDSSGSWESLPSSTNSEDDNDDDTDALFSELEDRFIDSGWGGECLREIEDIDFEFVYALHTFVATVEGQANATKGDTMVLLDDSNSYWWLVRVVKDSSIGYLPAEHIETPTERLARLNKHRNIDLSATMLSDSTEKSRNPIKKAMRRRNAKTVQFAAPTYVEASDNEYSSEDEEAPAVEPYAAAVQAEEPQQNGETHDEEEQVADARQPHDEAGRTSTSSRNSFDREQAATIAPSVDEPQTSPKLVDKTEAAPLKSRKGTPRNADSFLKDDNIETRKITLTPGLLREDGTAAKSPSSESTRNGSLENLVKTVSPPEPIGKKDSKKEKEKKKGGMLSGLFRSKKDKKKPATKEEELSDVEKPSNEYSRESPAGSPMASGRSSPSSLSPTDTRRQEVQSRQPARAKLQKAPPSNGSSPVREREMEPQQLQVQKQQPLQQQPQQMVQTQQLQQQQVQSQEPALQQQPSNESDQRQVEAPRGFVAELEGSQAAQEMESPVQEKSTDASAAQLRDLNVDTAQQDRPKDGPLSPITNILKRDDSKTQKPAKAKRSKQRVELDDFDSPADEEGPNPFKEQEERERAASAAAAGDDEDGEERLSDSPVEINHDHAFMHGTDSIHIPTPSPDDQPEEDDDEEPESLTSSPSIIEHPAEPHEPSDAQEDSESTPTAPRSPNPADPSITKAAPHHAQPNRGLSTDSSATSSSSTHLSPASSISQQTWSDSSLRAWLEDGSEVRDMMVMIHDKSGVVPVSDDHPMMAGLFTEQRKGVKDMMGQLDGLLGSYLQRKGISLG